MDKQKSSGVASFIRGTKDIVTYATELKVDIGSQVCELIAALKDRERKLCMHVDQQCLEQIDAYWASEMLECCNMEVNNHNEICYFTPRLEFHSDFKNCKNLLQNYGQLKEFNCSSKIACESQIVDKNQLPKEQTDTQNVLFDDELVPLKDSVESFEFVDSVECLLSEKARGKCPMATATLPKTIEENLPETKDLELFEKVSCCSVDSFDVIQADCCGMNDLASDIAQSELPSTPDAKPVNQSSCNKRNLGYPIFYLPNLQRREQRDNEWLARAVRHSAKGMSESASTAKEDVLPTTLEANGITCNKPVSPSAGREDADKPANALQASFRVYLQKEDLEDWIHPKRKSGGSDYEQWVAKSPCNSKDFDISDSVISAFTRQLKSFAV